MPSPPVTLDALRRLIGRHVRYRRVPHRVIEVLEDGPSVVLKSLQADCDTLQADQFGEVCRRVPPISTIPVLARDGTSLSPLFEALEFDGD